jgi:hypothetical protein
MMKRYAWAALGLLALLTACPGTAKKDAASAPAPAPDYNSVRQHSEEAHQKLNQETQQAPGDQSQ